ncbi:MAG TPA: hypothetical protein VFF95_14970 [Candidatus Binatus sp.]|nr:hypothetical protein [Candidatus Binatus sp.]
MPSRVSWLSEDGRRAHFAKMVIAETEKESRVTDLVFTLVTIGFFLVAIGYLRGCERLR